MIELIEGENMNNFFVQVGSGFAFGTGLILAAAIIKVLFHIGIC